MPSSLCPDLDLAPPFTGISAQRKTPLGTAGGRCYSPLSVFQTPPPIKEEEAQSEAQEAKAVSSSSYVNIWSPAEGVTFVFSCCQCLLQLVIRENATIQSGNRRELKCGKKCISWNNTVVMFICLVCFFQSEKNGSSSQESDALTTPPALQNLRMQSSIPPYHTPEITQRRVNDVAAHLTYNSPFNGARPTLATGEQRVPLCRY